MTDKGKRRAGKKEKRHTFEEALARLEQIAGQLENEELGLEKAISLAEEGLELSRFCEQQLTEAQGKIEKLVERMGVIEAETAEDAGELEDDAEDEG